MKLNRQTAWERYIEEADRLPSRPRALDERVTNGSFEEGAGPWPRGWHLAAGELGESTEWCADGGTDGGRCLRISPRDGGASWYSDPIPVTAGAEYLVRCATRREGLRHWAHACEINWLSLVFRDDDGRAVREDPERDQPLILLRTRQTDGWVDGWRHVAAPREAATLEIGFRIVRGEPDLDDAQGFRRYWHGDIDSGQWWIDEVRLERLPLPVVPERGVLALHISGGDARVRIANGQGETFAPVGSLTYACQGEGFHPLRENARVYLSPGSYHVEAQRGFQREPFSKEVEIVSGHESPLTVELPRIADWAAYGWYTGDHHNHLSFHGATRHPFMTIDDVCRVGRGEGLDYLSFCGELVDQHAYAEWLEAGRPDEARPDGAFEREDFVGGVSHEVTQDLLGHVCLINPPGRIEPGHPWWLSPTNGELALALHRGRAQGWHGAAVMAHPYFGLDRANLRAMLSDPSRTAMYRELPVDVILGFADTMDFLAAEPPEDLEQRFEDYFRLLNLGLRIGVTASSDAYADQGTEIVGSLVTLVQANRPTLDGIAEGYAAQRTMASNGPLLRFHANGQGIGGTTRGPAVRLEAEAFSNWGLTRLEVVANGEVIADATPDDEGWARIAREASVERSGWLVARAWGPGHPCLNLQPVPVAQRAERGQWAVSSPVYVEVTGKPFVRRKQDVAYFVEWIDGCTEAIRGRKAFVESRGIAGLQPRDEDVRKALELFRRAREAFEELG